MSKVNKTISEKINELSKMVEWFDSSDFKLEEAMDKFKQAEEQASDIEKDLKNLKNEITIIQKKFDGE